MISDDVEVLIESGWIDTLKFENCLNDSKLREIAKPKKLKIILPEGCNIMVDSAVRLLSYVNQLCDIGTQVNLDFIAGKDGTYGYLDRIGFFDHLDERILILPKKPILSSAKIYRGSNPGVFEIIPIDPLVKDNDLPSTLTDRLLENINFLTDKSSFEQASFTIFSELIENIYLHSETPINGYLAFQVYPKSRNVKVAVSDSGKGLIYTLRPSIAKHYPKYINLPDSEVILKVFTEGLSKDGVDKGCGLKACARHALKFNASLDLGLPNAHFHLYPTRRGIYGYSGRASIQDSYIHINGTHITFDFRLDNN